MFNSVFRRMSFGVLLLMVGTVPTLIASEEVQWSQSIEESISEAKTTGKPIGEGSVSGWMPKRLRMHTLSSFLKSLFPSR